MPDDFKVVYSGDVRKALMELLQQAAATSSQFGRRAIDAVKTIDAQLRQRPREFGEACFHLQKLEIRIGVVRPVAVEFGVHAAEHIVFVSKHNLLTDHNSTAD